MTPTTAAVTPVRAAARCVLCRNLSTYGAPSSTNRKHGTNVTQQTSRDASTAANHGSSEPGSR